jgi:hypothetical protein
MLCTSLGCVNFITANMPMDKDIAIGDLDKIKPGMTEREVILIFGRPLSFGLDEDGKEYLRYEVSKFSKIEEGASLPFIGAISTSATVKGFIFNVYVKEGIVQGKSEFFIQDVASKLGSKP